MYLTRKSRYLVDKIEIMIEVFFFIYKNVRFLSTNDIVFLVPKNEKMAGNCPWYWTANSWNVPLVAIKQMEGKKKWNKDTLELNWTPDNFVDTKMQFSWKKHCSGWHNFLSGFIFPVLATTSLNFQTVPQLNVNQEWNCLMSIHWPRLVKCFVALVNSSYSWSPFAARYIHKRGQSPYLLKFRSQPNPMASGWSLLFSYFPMFYFSFSH